MPDATCIEGIYVHTSIRSSRFQVTITYLNILNEAKRPRLSSAHAEK